jgi:hypothetical protein
MQPFKKLKAHTKTATDLAYLNSETLLATGGQSSESRNVCLWDTLQADSKACVKGMHALLIPPPSACLRPCTRPHARVPMRADV